jgi:F-type H+-transporting ATPase subunit alpha
VGGAAQTKIIKKLGGGVRLALAQYRELAAFAQFASDLDEATRRQLDKGKVVTELMKQKQYSPLKVSELALTLYAIEHGFFDKIGVEDALKTETNLHSHMKSKHDDLLAVIDAKPELTDEVDGKLKAAMEEFFETVA